MQKQSGIMYCFKLSLIITRVVFEKVFVLAKMHSYKCLLCLQVHKALPKTRTIANPIFKHVNQTWPISESQNLTFFAFIMPPDAVPPGSHCSY